ncbi:phage holin family protein [Kriegella aquimaris]|uniref:Putative Holin-X, holin superfamily III n=1 Tax=Kriegella aquimaris TaxID=192904 RepID=A0A1G9QFD3_9FLAO|nr:phage holin family protein [Kriegella aquimaris]SDM09471.1 Putative Holin-X, holin superfamily III [Kriegella aquimaris]
MAFDDVKESLTEAEASIRSYVESSQEYYKLKGFKFLMRGITSFSKILMVGVVALLALLFLSFAASFGIGQALNNTFYGFLCVGLFYLLIGLLLYFLRHKLNKPLLKKFSEFYFDDI